MNRRPLKILNGIELILDDQGNHLNSYTISLESFGSFRGPLVCKLVTGQELFFAVSYSKPALMCSTKKTPKKFNFYLLPRPRGLSEHNKTLFFFVECGQWLFLLESQSAIEALAFNVNITSIVVDGPMPHWFIMTNSTGPSERQKSWWGQAYLVGIICPHPPPDWNRVNHGLRTLNEDFFHWNPELLGLSRQIGQINKFWGIWSIFGKTTVHWVPCPCFPLFKHCFWFTKPLYTHPKYLFGIGIWIWAAKN